MIIDWVLIITSVSFVKRRAHALSGIFKYKDSPKRKLIMNAFITSQLSYCFLIGKFHSRALKNSGSMTTVRLVYPDQSFLTFQQLLMKDETVSVQQKSYKYLQSKFTKQNIIPELICDVFQFTKNRWPQK